MSNPRIYLSSPHIGSEELELVREAFASNWIAPLGPQVDEFEKEFAATVGTPHALALSSGTAALHLALHWLKLKPGDEVLCPLLTFVASVNPVLYEGATPVFVDSEMRSWNMDPALLTEAIEDRIKRGKRPKAVILVHLYGQSADIDSVTEICTRHEIPLIEDAAEALGATYKGIAAGSVGLCGIFSFNGNKIITTSGGGMLVSQDKAMIDKARYWATQSRNPAPHYEHSEVGYNYRLSNVLAAIGRGQLRVLKQRVEARRRNFEYYRKALGGLLGLTFMPEPDHGYSTRWLTCITINSEEAGIDREILRVAMAGENIEARPVWKPMHLQPLFRHCAFYGGAVAERLFLNGLCLPSGSNLTTSDLDRVIDVIQSVYARR
jgi:pyridoxal phosphate-dependent aminotransferase EpsN